MARSNNKDDIKFAEFPGYFAILLARMREHAAELIEYKQASSPWPSCFSDLTSGSSLFQLQTAILASPNSLYFCEERTGAWFI